MTIQSKSFKKGIKTIPTSVPATEEGELRNDSSDNKQKVYTEGQERSLVTEDQTQALSNKTIDSSNNTVTIDADEATVENLEVDNLKTGVLDTDGTLSSTSDSKIPSSLAVKTYVDSSVAGKDEASEISYDNAASGLTATDVQAAVDEVEARLDTTEGNVTSVTSDLANHISNTTNAHAASAISNVPSGNLAATDVQAALNELQTDVDTKALGADLTDHINDSTAAHDSAAIGYDNAASGLTATDVKNAIDEVNGNVSAVESDITTAQSTIDNHIANATNAHAASAISNIPSGNLAATDVQTALNELQTEVDGKANESTVTAHTSATSGVHGVTGDVVGTTDTQDLSNKSIISPERLDVKQDTYTNLGIYASSASNGQFVFATDTKEMLQVVDGELVVVGGGGGSGDLTAYYNEDFETDTNADSFGYLEGGVIGYGALTSSFGSVDTVTPLAGSQSLSFTIPASGSGKYCLLNLGLEISVPLFAQSKKQLLTFESRNTGDTGDFSLFLWDDTAEDTVKDSEGNTLFINPVSGIKTNSLWFETNGTEELRWGVMINTDNTGAVLTIDNIQIDGSPDKNISVSRVIQSLSRSGSDGRTVTGGTESIPFGTGTDSVNGWTYGADGSTSTSGNYYTVKSSNSVININGMLRVASGGSDFSVYLYVNGTQYKRIGYTSQATSNIVEFSYLSDLSEFTLNDKLSLIFGGPSSATLETIERDHYLNIVETEYSANVVVSGTNSAKLAYVEARGNAGQSITANVTDIPFIGVSDEFSLWDGSGFTATKDTILSISGGVVLTGTSPASVQAYIDGVADVYLGIGTNSSTTVKHISGVVRLNAGQRLSFRMDGSSSISNVPLVHFLTIQELPQYEETILAYLEESQAATVGVERRTGRSLNGKSIYEMYIKVTSDITTTGTITNIATDLDLIDKINYTSTFWQIADMRNTDGSNRAFMYYDSSDGGIKSLITGSNSIKAGSTFKLEYTK